MARQLMRGCILEGLQEALAQFSRMALNSKQVSDGYLFSHVREGDGIK